MNRHRFSRAQVTERPPERNRWPRHGHCEGGGWDTEPGLVEVSAKGFGWNYWKEVYLGSEDIEMEEADGAIGDHAMLDRIT